MQTHCSYYGVQDENNMRLHQLEHQHQLSEHIYTTSNISLSDSDTKQNIQQWYDTAFSTAPTPYWIADGTITDWQASLHDWLSSMNIPKLQLLDDSWRGYATNQHYIHYLKSQQSHMDAQAAELDAHRAKLTLLLADAEQQADDYFTNKTTRRRTQQ